MINPEYLAVLRIQIEDQADLKKINRVRVRFDVRDPKTFGVYDLMRRQFYELRGFEVPMLENIASKAIDYRGIIQEVMELGPTGLSACFIFNQTQFSRTIILPQVSVIQARMMQAGH